MFYPKPGDTIVTREMGNFICANKEIMVSGLLNSSYDNHAIFGYRGNLDNPPSVMCWKTNDGKKPDGNWDIIEIIPQQKENSVMIESTVSHAQNPHEEITYPCVMERVDTGLVVMFDSCNSGVVIKEDMHYRVGMAHKAQRMEFFTPFYGSITITVSHP